jgi:hypothetical protein
MHKAWSRRALQMLFSLQVPPTLTWTQDTETARDVFAFAGPLVSSWLVPTQRTNKQLGCAKSINKGASLGLASVVVNQQWGTARLPYSTTGTSIAAYGGQG